MLSELKTAINIPACGLDKHSSGDSKTHLTLSEGFCTCLIPFRYVRVATRVQPADLLQFARRFTQMQVDDVHFEPEKAF